MQPQTIREQVTNRIRNELIAGQHEAGAMLREVDLASRLGVSRGPVRDAFIQLSHEGYLAYHANRGVMVRQPPNPDDRKFITSIRQQIEIHVINQGIKALSDEGIERIRAALSNLKTACDSGLAVEVAMCDVVFHETIMNACGGEDFVPAWRQLCSRMLLTYSRLVSYTKVHQEHDKIFEALCERNAKATVAALKENIK